MAKAALAAAVVAALVLTPCSGSSVYLAGLCSGHQCKDPRYPLLDFDPERSECICRAHPCWDNAGIAHRCGAPEFPYLHFTYSPDKNLTCSCSSVPQYDSLHVSRDRCAGEFCDSADFPVLDWDPQQQKCLCRAHPCWDQGGVKHQCTDRMFPILHYREEVKEDGSAKPICECNRKFEKPVAGGLRGSRQSLVSKACTWSNFAGRRKSNLQRPGWHRG